MGVSIRPNMTQTFTICPLVEDQLPFMAECRQISTLPSREYPSKPRVRKRRVGVAGFASASTQLIDGRVHTPYLIYACSR